MNSGPITIVIGTRPEVIKMAPVYFALKKIGLPVLWCSTAQHMTLLAELMDLFQIPVDYNLHIGKPNQTLAYVTAAAVESVTALYQSVRPSFVMLQGDTSTAMAAALAAFYQNIPVCHVEAGLRTPSLVEPFPEEMNRRVIGMLARYHFAPTPLAVGNLLAEGIERTHVLCTGNTVVDALAWVKERIAHEIVAIDLHLQQLIDRCKISGKKIILLTVHRRESFNGGIAAVLRAVKNYVRLDSQIQVIYPMHPNPLVQKAVEESGIANVAQVYCCNALSYSDLVYVLDAADLIITDSGGIQEEGVSLGKSVIVVRNTTERWEGVWEGYAVLTGTHEQNITQHMRNLLTTTSRNQPACQVYGDGHAAERIARVMFDAYNQLHKTMSAHTISNVVNKKIGESMKKVSIVGLGYIGLPTALIAAKYGFSVVGYDIDAQKVAAINAGNPVIQEPEVQDVLQEVIHNSSFHASTSLEQADYYIIAVPTPFKGGKRADLSYVWAAAKAVAERLTSGAIVILESTVPVGTTLQLARYLEQESSMKEGKDFFVAYCPERVLPGNILNELRTNDRVIGGVTQESMHRARTFYAQFVTGNLYLTNAATAEMVKLVENSSRDVALAFAHQVSSMSYEAGLDPYEVIELANKHPRVNILTPTSGVGGHCIAVDPWFLVETFPTSSLLLQTARRVNDAKPYEVIERINATVRSWRIQHKRAGTIVILGLTYKPNVDDVRESPALEIAKHLVSMPEATVLVVDPYVHIEQLPWLSANQFVSLANGIERADIIICLVAHQQFKGIESMIKPEQFIIDSCGIMHKKRSTEHALLFWPASMVQGTQLWESAVKTDGHVTGVKET